MQANIVLLARYNAWMNAKLYDAAATLSPQDLALDRGAFFGSIIGTLNHIVVGDTVWLKRFASHPAQPATLEVVRQLPTPAALNELLVADLAALRQRRSLLDEAISAWAAALTSADLASALSYVNMAGVAQSKPLDSLLLHFFNHQTHHRGQTTTLLAQAGVDVGVTDLVALIPNAL